jgi:hypothetical protein
MSDVLVLKELGFAMPLGGGTMQPMLMQGAMSQEAPLQQYAGVNPQGMAGLGQDPVTNQFQAAPVVDDESGKELGSYTGDRYGATALNQMNRREMREGEGRASGIGDDTYQRGRFNPARYESVGQGLKTIGEKTQNIPVIGRMTRPLREMNTDNFGQDTGRSAGQVAFDRGSKFGEMAHNFGNRMGRTVGVLAGLTQLANAGAAGQDALSGGVGAFQTGQVTGDSLRKPLAEGLGGATADAAGRSVGVVKPEKQYLQQIASPTPETPNEQQLTTYQGKSEVMSTDKFGNSVPFKSKRAQEGAAFRLAQARGDDTSAGTVMEPYEPPMGGNVAVKNGMAMGQGGQTTFSTGNPAQDTANVQAANPVAVAPPTPQTSDINEITGKQIAAGLSGDDEDAKAGAEIQNNIEAAKQLSGKKQSMTQQTQLPIEKMLVGVV